MHGTSLLCLSVACCAAQGCLVHVTKHVAWGSSHSWRKQNACEHYPAPALAITPTVARSTQPSLALHPLTRRLLPPAVGCIMGCTFCATGTMGIKGDLTAGEIIEQLVHARAVLPIRNIGELLSQLLADPDSA